MEKKDTYTDAQIYFNLGKIKELKHVIETLANCEMNSPFNPYFLRDMMTKKYITRLKMLARKHNKSIEK